MELNHQKKTPPISRGNRWVISKRAARWCDETPIF